VETGLKNTGMVLNNNNFNFVVLGGYEPVPEIPHDTGAAASKAGCDSGETHMMA